MSKKSDLTEFDILKNQYEAIKASRDSDKENFQKLKTSFSNCMEKEGSSDEMKEMYGYFDKALSAMYEKMYGMEDFIYSMMYKHTSKHAPSPQTTSQMQAALKAFGMDNDYEVAKKKIWMDE